MKKLLGSSADEQKLALTIKGLLTSIVPIILLVAQVKGYSLTNEQINPIIDEIYNTVLYATLCWGGLMTIFGWLRKCWFWAKDYFKSLKK